MISLNNIENLLPIEGTFLNLRRFTIDNITDQYLSWLNDPAVVRFSNQRFTFHTRQTAVDYLQTFNNSQNLFLAIYLKDGNHYVGTMTVYFSIAHETADVGIMIGDRTCWRRKIGGNAWGTVIDWLINVIGIRKVTAGTLGCNHGMIKIMLNCGMQPDGIRKEQECIDDQIEDILHFAKFKNR